MKKRKGNVHINVIFIFTFTVMMTVLYLSVVGAVVDKIRLDNFTYEIIRVAELEGMVGENTIEAIENLEDSLNISPIIVWSGTDKVQINDVISVQCSLDSYIGVGNSKVLVTLSSSAVGRSEVYWKE